jgi:prophage regulatory protein
MGKGTQSSLAQALLTEGELREIDGLSRGLRRKLIAQGRYPKAVQVGDRRIAWRVSDVDQWLATLPPSTACGGGL